MNTAVNWFEIPAANFDRAVKFYSHVFDGELTVIDMESRQLALLPPGSGPESEVNPGGSILHTADFSPSRQGAIIYLKPEDGIENTLNRVTAAGGEIMTPKMDIGSGLLATFIDSEGNTVGLVEWTN